MASSFRMPDHYLSVVARSLAAERRSLGAVIYSVPTSTVMLCIYSAMHATWRGLAECNGANVKSARRRDHKEGRRASRGGMWVVEEVLDVRRPVGGRGPQLEVRVMWAGQWGAQQVQWIRISQLNGTAKRAARHMEAVRLKRRASVGEPERRAGAALEGNDEGGGGRPRKSPRLAGAAASAGLDEAGQRKRRRADGERQLRKRRATEGQALTGGAVGDPRAARRDGDSRGRRDRSRDASVAPAEGGRLRRSGRRPACDRLTG